MQASEKLDLLFLWIFECQTNISNTFLRKSIDPREIYIESGDKF